jgi:hypothetical protein
MIDFIAHLLGISEEVEVNKQKIFTLVLGASKLTKCDKTSC